MHHGLAAQRHADRAIVLQAAHRAHPERFVRGVPVPLALPTEVWINKPAKQEVAAIERVAV